MKDQQAGIHGGKPYTRRTDIPVSNPNKKKQRRLALRLADHQADASRDADFASRTKPGSMK